MINQMAPNFTLTDHLGKDVELAELLKKSSVVLIFYPYDQTPTCTRQMCSLNDDMSEFQKAGITLLGINNAAEESHKNFVDAHALRMQLLSDTNYEVSKAYGTLFQIGPIKVIRRTVIGIAQSGKIIFWEPGIPSNQRIIAAMQGKK